MKFTYLLIDFFTILVPLVFSFHPKLNFQKSWSALFPAILITGTFFIIWDVCFTDLKIWGFNQQYLTGVHLGNLPIEEVLFFFCIPYSCVFTYQCLSIRINKSFSKTTTDMITIVLIAFSAFMAARYNAERYTLYTFVVMAALLFIAQFWVRVDWLPKYYITYLVLLVPFIIVNGLLTGTGLQNPVVWYNNSENMGLRILTIPVEDIFYGSDLILLNVLLFTTIQPKKLIYNLT